MSHISTGAHPPHTLRGVSRCWLLLQQCVWGGGGCEGGLNLEVGCVACCTCLLHSVTAAALRLLLHSVSFNVV